MMRHIGFNWLVIVLLALSIAWKVAVKPEDPNEVQAAIQNFLVQQHFDISVSGESLEYTAVIDARAHGCHLRVIRISPLGHEVNLVRKANASDDQIFYVFRGVVYREQPVGLTLANYLWFRFLRELGLVTRVPPVLAVVTSCVAEQLPWNTVGELQPT
jgi:hypothetical protein